MSEGANDRYRELWAIADEHLVRYRGDFYPLVVERAEGIYIYDQDGRAILDFSSGQMCATLGHNHPAVVGALKRASEKVIHLYTNMMSPMLVELADKLADLLPPSLQKSMFPNTGSESNEAALRMAKIHTGGYEVVGLSGSWHGQTVGAASSTYATGRKGHGPTLPGTMAIPAPNSYHCPIKHCADKCDMTCLDVGFEMADRQSVGQYAAFIAEPVQGAGGVVIPPEGYFERAKEKCEERGMMMILDEAQTGLGRVGKNFAFEGMGIKPDILTLSKTLGAGVPLSATVTSSEIEESCYEKGFSYYTSHLSDPMPIEVGVSVLDVVVNEKLANRAAEMGPYVMSGLKELQSRHEVIGDVRGVGLFIGVEFVKDRETKEAAPVFLKRLLARSLELGLNLIPASAEGISAVRLAPPLFVTRDQVDSALGILDQALSDCAKDLNPTE
ncbi:MAG: aspartate aminotransferase family protein [Pseudomonadota bacterium]|nr:aspartate aminotransferase family protein [Pseudomonadota bacterium]